MKRIVLMAAFCLLMSFNAFSGEGENNGKGKKNDSTASEWVLNGDICTVFGESYPDGFVYASGTLPPGETLIEIDVTNCDGLYSGVVAQVTAQFRGDKFLTALSEQFGFRIRFLDSNGQEVDGCYNVFGRHIGLLEGQQVLYLSINNLTGKNVRQADLRGNLTNYLDRATSCLNQ